MYQQQKKVTATALWEVNLKTKIMKSYEINKREVETKLKKQKKENALDIISKSLQKNINANYPNGSDGILINL